MSEPIPELESSSRRAARIARIEALRDEVAVGRYEQRLIEPASWGWLVLTFVAASFSIACVAPAAQHFPPAFAVAVTGVGLFLSVVLVDRLFAPTPNPSPPSEGPAGVRPRLAAAGVRHIVSWTIRTALAVLVLAVGAFTAIVVGAPQAPVLERFAIFIEEQRAGIERGWGAAGERPAVRGRTQGANWRMLERDGRYVAAPFAEAEWLCAGLGAGWRTPRLADFPGLEPAPDETSTLRVWVAGDRASSAQIVAGSWLPTGFLSSADAAHDRFHVLCVRPKG